MTEPPISDRPHLAEGLTAPKARDPFHRSSAFASLMLVVLTALWGLSFSLMKLWQAAADSGPVPSGAFSATLVVALSTVLVRTGLALPLLVAVRPDFVTGPSRRAHLCGVALGVVFFGAFTCLVTGLNVISPARSALLINLTCVFVPLMIWFWLGTPPSRLLVIGIVLCLGGATVLTAGGVGGGAGVSWGDAISVLAAVLFALQVVLLDRLGQKERSQHFTLMFLGTTAFGSALVLLLALGGEITAWVGWLSEMFSRPNMVPIVIGMSVTTALSLSLMSTYQPRVGANRAALIYLLEIVFSAAFGIAFGFDELTWLLILSGTLIIAGNLVVELPGLRRKPK